LASFVTKLKKVFLISAASSLLFLVFILDVIRRSVEIEIGWILFVRDIFVIAAFLIFYLLIESLWKRDQNPAKKLGFGLVLSLVVGIASSLLFFISQSGFDTKNYLLIPLGFDSIVWSNIYGVVLSITMLVVLLIIRDIIFSKRRKATRRNFIFLLILIILTTLSTFITRPMETNIISSILFGLTILAMFLNSFRLSWIVYLSKREKLFSIVYGFLLFCIFIGFSIITSKGDSEVGKALLFYSPPLQSFVRIISLFATIYFGMTFVSTLFHLPTAEAFDRKASEVSSLHNLSRLVTQVFDFEELVDTVTTMTLEVCEAKSTWLEIIQITPNSNVIHKLVDSQNLSKGTGIVSLQNITRDDAQAIMKSGEELLRDSIFKHHKPVVIDDVKEDKRFHVLGNAKNRFSSIAIVPLLSHETVIGILYATKEVEYGFDKDNIDVISSFADQAAIAIENSRLIEKSIERERLMREMLLAQDMQKRLLPQQLPRLKELEIEALSTPAFEVGGDYYDFTQLDEDHLGILVGDVSGKGVSAAFYMAEMKGIFQSLSKIYFNPRDFLVHAHKTLMGTIDKRSFISIIYAVIHLPSGKMKIARAGHCPMLYVSKGVGKYIKPLGLGLGMGSSDFFEATITQEEVQLSSGDFVVFYTDGVIEAHPGNGDEYGYDRLLEVVQASDNKSAVDVRDAIIMTVDNHLNHETPEDDLTIVVMKWKKD
jgi:sigma-B regulation protein RsbU (phosphoserine phosphatase)